MKYPVYLDPRVKDVLRTAALTLRTSIVDVLLDLGDDPTPPGATLDPDLPGVYELTTPRFRAIYSFGPEIDIVTVWVLHIDT